MFDTYLQLVQDSLTPAKTLLVPRSKLLVTSLFDYVKLLETAANSNEGINIDPDEAAIFDSIVKNMGENYGLYCECYMLVNLSPNDSSAWEPLKREFILPVPVLGDMDGVLRLRGVENWLMAEDEKSDEEYFCDYFAEEILPEGYRIYVPNRVPARFQSPDEGVAFLSVF